MYYNSRSFKGEVEMEIVVSKMMITKKKKQKQKQNDDNVVSDF